MQLILTTLAATLSIQSGYFLWKIAADSLPRISTGSSGSVFGRFLTSWQWLLGSALAIVGWILFIKATDLGEVSIVQPLMSVGELYLVLLAVVFLGERLTAVEWFGLALTVLGAVTLSSQAREVAPVGIHWDRMWILGVFGAVSILGLTIFGRRARRPEIPLAIAVGIGFGLGAVLTELMTAYLTLTGQELGSAASVLNPILPFMVGANVAGLLVLQLAFQLGRASVIIPVQLSVLNSLVVLAGALVFSEAITPLKSVGIALIIAGAGLLHAPKKP